MQQFSSADSVNLIHESLALYVVSLASAVCFLRPFSFWSKYVCEIGIEPSMINQETSVCMLSAPVAASINKRKKAAINTIGTTDSTLVSK